MPTTPAPRPTRPHLATALQGLALACAAHAAAAQSPPTQLNGLPCIPEVCLGDGLDRLTSIPWDTAISSRSGAEGQAVADRKLSPPEANRMQAHFRGAVAPAAAYLHDAKFDQRALALLAKVEASCNQHRLQGSFVSPNGNPTLVGLQLLPDGEDLGRHRWQVTYIQRAIPSAVTTSQRAEATQTLRERYTDFDLLRRPIPPGTARARFTVMDSSAWGFSLTLLSPPELALKLRQHPACGGGGGAKAKLD